uniref:ABC transporter transmembrane domain-containing protein n=1 Tax=Marinobacterium profundum TaxID=1714300 RepID=UPI0008324DE3|nr:ABC transporter transmembrane domain-containing protein [Marinobacterium profundum]
MLQQIHLFGDDLVSAYFSHSHWWLHTTVHWILLGAPVTMVAVLALRLQTSVRRYLQANPDPLSRRRIHNKERNKERNSAIQGSVYSYIIQHTGRQQLMLLGLALTALPLLYVTLEIPKHIINHAIGSDDFPIQIIGIEAQQIEFLFGLCLLYLLTILLSGSLKYSLNLSKGLLAESVLRRLRVKVYSIWHRRERDNGHSQIIPVIVQEVEAIAGFAGDIIVLPVFQGGTFLTILFFLFMQDPLLGAAAISLLPLQLVVIPHLQKKVNKLGRDRMQEVRNLGQIIGEMPASSYSKTARAMRSIRNLQSIRVEIFRRKFLMKGLYNFATHLTPFFFYTIGGYLVIEGKLTFGALVAALAAHKDFSSPLKELFKYYQTGEDVRVRWVELSRLLQP